jgi:hypothetical protein
LVVLLFIEVTASIVAGALAWLLSGVVAAILTASFCLSLSQILTCGWWLLQDSLKQAVQRAEAGIRAVKERTAEIEGAMPVWERTHKQYAGRHKTAVRQLDYLRRVAALPARYQQAAARWRELDQSIKTRQFWFSRTVAGWARL